MTLFIEGFEHEIFSNMVINEFQLAESQLRKYAREKSVIGAKRYTFNKLGILGAVEHKSGNKLSYQNQSVGKITMSVRDYVVPTVVDWFLETKVNWSDQSEAATEIAHAMQRKIDQVILDAFEERRSDFSDGNFPDFIDINTTGSSFTYGGRNISTDLSLLNKDSLARARKIFNYKRVPKQDRVGLLSSDAYMQLLIQPETASSDFTMQKTLPSGELAVPFMGFKYEEIGRLGTEEGLKVEDVDNNTKVTRMYLFQKTGLCMGINQNVKMHHQKDLDVLGSKLATTMSMVAKILQDDAVVQVNYFESK